MRVGDSYFVNKVKKKLFDFETHRFFWSFIFLLSFILQFLHSFVHSFGLLYFLLLLLLFLTILKFIPVLFRLFLSV